MPGTPHVHPRLNKHNEYLDRRTNGQATVATGENIIVAIGVAWFVLWVVIIVLITVAAS